MKVEVLISCMHQKDTSIIYKSNIQSNVVVINQCNENSEISEFFKNKKNESCQILMINTKERGLSNSRNLAIKNATGDICIICDDDEKFSNTYVEDIVKAFQSHKDADVIAFKLIRPQKKYREKGKKLSPLDCLKVSSVEIAFKLKRIKEKNILFDPQIGSGISKAGGEENVFLHECLKKGLKIYYHPIIIAELLDAESQWLASKYSKDYFIDRGKFTRKLIGGKIFSIIYAVYFTIAKIKEYRSKNHPIKAFAYMLKGIFS